MKRTILLFATIAFFTLKSQSQTVTDYDGNVYNTVTIGTQVWMKENLKTAHYKNGTVIPITTDGNGWVNLSTGSYCDFNNVTGNSTTYGKLYNWFAVNSSSKICPTGWHVPTDAEWITLSTFLGDTSTDGGKMKETGTTHWHNPNTGANNTSNFTGLPGGYRDYFGLFHSLDSIGRWWSATEAGSLFVSKAWSRGLSYNSAVFNSYREYENDGLSVRCIKDNNTGVEEMNNFEKIDIYPNPAFEKIIIDNPALANDEILSIYDIKGQLMIQKALKNKKEEITISALTKGVYIVKIEGGKTNKVGKFSKD